MSKYEGLESNFQITAANYLRSLGVLFFHCPNEIRAKPQYLKKRKAMGVLSGVSDLVILEPRGKYHGLMIELKVKGGKVSENQKEFIKQAEKRGYKGFVCWSVDDLIEIVDNYLKQ